MARVRLFAAAADAAGTDTATVPAATLGDLTAALVDAHGAGFARVLGRCSVLVDGCRTDSPDAPLSPDALVDILPPFAGG